MKKTIIILLITIVSITLVGCGSNNEKKENTNKGNESYIENSKKSAYVDIAASYVEAIRTKVNEGKDLRLYENGILYMIPVGDDISKSCVEVEVGGNPVFGDKWNYAYVGVTFEGTGYNYYFISEDNNGVGIPMLTYKDLADNGREYIYKNYGSSLSQRSITKDFSNILKNNYGKKVELRTLTNNEEIAFDIVLKNSSNITKITYLDNNCK